MQGDILPHLCLEGDISDMEHSLKELKEFTYHVTNRLSCSEGEVLQTSHTHTHTHTHIYILLVLFSMRSDCNLSLSLCSKSPLRESSSQQHLW